MSSEFITNQKKLLSTIFKDILPSANSMDALVGYFYFSGFEEIYKNIRDKKVRILVGLDAEKGTVNVIKEVEIIGGNSAHISNDEIRRKYFCDFVDIFNSSDYFDNKVNQEAFRIFVAKINKGELEIKKTKEPNHAKLYLFENKKEFSQGGSFPGTMITGSSNLTKSGLSGRYEMNVVFRDDNYTKAKEIFEELWESSTELISRDNIKEFEEEIIKKIWLDKLPDPYFLYLRVLNEYFSASENVGIVKTPSEITKKKYFNLKYQIDAIKDTLSIIKRHDGVIISDVVGLGKSIIASAAAHNLDVGKIVVICPPHLKNQWENYKYDFNFNAKIYTSGLIGKALKETENREEKRLIIVDEAHKYRNEKTEDYNNLHQLCAGNFVILLTATPFNNRPEDVFALLKLFQIPGKSTIKTIDNLGRQFRELSREYKKIHQAQKSDKKNKVSVEKKISDLSDKIRDIIAPVTIRRSRIDLKEISEYQKDLKKQNIHPSEVNAPKEADYELGELTDLYLLTLEKVAPLEENKGFIGARYKPTSYLKDGYKDKYESELQEKYGNKNIIYQSQKNLAKFMKRLLVKRFESSIHAFQTTLNSMISSSEKMLDWHQKGKVPIYKKGNLPDPEYFFNTTNDDLSGELEEINYEERLEKYEEKGLEIIKAGELKDKFTEDLKSDIKLLNDIKKEWFENGIKADVKARAFKEIVKEQLENEPNRKIAVFTEYADTADYLYEQLKNEFRIIKYSSKDAKSVRDAIEKNFDASVAEENQEDKFDILIATDAISEGCNLHRAGTIFNYDIPYNPTRIIQRVGRINRINKRVFDKLYIYNFFPSPAGEKEIRSKQIASLKISMINNLLGQDTKILTADEILKSFNDDFKKEMNLQEQKSWDADFREEWQQVKNFEMKIFKQVLKIPKRVRIRREIKKEKSGVLVFGKKNDECVFKLGVNENEYKNISAAEALTLLKANKKEKPFIVNAGFENIYQNVKTNLFSQKTQIAKDKGLRDAINKIVYLKENFSAEESYFENLLFVLSELESLPDLIAKKIRAINLDKNKIEREIEKLKKEIPRDYLSAIINKSKKTDEGDESVIFAEELK
jgi:superfamily II DNA or RNA helicase